MNILLVCAGGISTSFFVQNIRHEFEEQKIEGSVMAKSITEVPEFINMVDIIFIAPQAVFFKEKVEKFCSQRSIPCQVIDPATYGQMDGKKIVSLAKNILQKGG
ncbi:MAG: PTS sugar transporter subunit IIB [Pelolinea sp.]|jgi:PTS system cellobiose-specific IIB component|nr:PTS sugar transporter subunit IIB [Pelolinea sp.]